jgi:hypothetical protein
MVTRHFCPTCGGRLYSSSERLPGMVTLPAGAFDGPAGIRPMMMVFAHRRQPWDALAADLPRFDGMPPFA